MGILAYTNVTSKQYRSGHGLIDVAAKVHNFLFLEIIWLLIEVAMDGVLGGQEMVVRNYRTCQYSNVPFQYWG